MDYQLGPGPLQVDQNTIDEKIKGDIGIVENGDVATHAIPSGYYVIWKGDLYVSKTDISSGTTLGTSNLTAKPNGLGAEVAALNSNIGSINSALRPSDAGWITDDNADNYKTTGQFMVARGWTNIPTGWGILTVIANRTDTIMQEYEAYNKKYIREFRNNAWSNWEQFALNSKIETGTDFDFTLNSSQTSQFEINKMRAKTFGGIYILCLVLNPLDAIDTGEIQLGEASVSPGLNTATVVTRNSDSKAVGSANLFENKKVYLHLTESVNQGNLIYISFATTCR